MTHKPRVECDTKKNTNVTEAKPWTPYRRPSRAVFARCGNFEAAITFISQTAALEWHVAFTSCPTLTLAFGFQSSPYPIGSILRESISFWTPEWHARLIFALFKDPLRLRSRCVPCRRWVTAGGFLTGRADRVDSCSCCRRGQLIVHGIAIDICVLERVQDGLFAALLIEPGLAISVDALLGKVVGGAASW